jgi:hypothetical protein
VDLKVVSELLGHSIEEARTYIKHSRRAGYSAAYRVERYLPPRQHRAAWPVQIVWEEQKPEGKTTDSSPLRKKENKRAGKGDVW